MDLADKADDRIQESIDAAIDQARRAPALHPKGSCHFCEEPLAYSLRFCDRGCAEDFEAEEEQLKRMGRR